MAEPPKPKIGTQILGAVAACMGGFSLGTVIGWSSPAQDILVEGGVTDDEFTHISSVMCLGAAAVQPYMFVTFDRIGRKWTMITIAIPMIIIWVLMGMVNNWIVFLAGRFFLGFCGGAFCVASPNYIGEFSDKHIRGSLGIMFQLLLVIGICLAYCSGLSNDRYFICLPMIAPPGICILMMMFLPESPVLLKMKKKDEKAAKALQFYRGKDYDISAEMKEIENYIKDGEGANFKENMKNKANVNAFIMLLVLHVVQQLSGINAIMFYAGSIFKSGSFFGLSSAVCTIVLGVVQVISCAITAGLVDKLGRRLLWLISLGTMVICLVVAGVYYIIKDQDEELSKKMEFVLVIAICIYVIGFCLGTGPLPWSMIGEMLSSGAKPASGPIITAVNWLLSYLVTLSFPYLNKWVGAGPVFLGFAVVCLLGFVFVLFLLVETKGKTLDEIQKELQSHKMKRQRGGPEAQ